MRWEWPDAGEAGGGTGRWRAPHGRSRVRRSRAGAARRADRGRRRSRAGRAAPPRAGCRRRATRRRLSATARRGTIHAEHRPFAVSPCRGSEGVGERSVVVPGHGRHGEGAVRGGWGSLSGQQIGLNRPQVLPDSGLSGQNRSGEGRECDHDRRQYAGLPDLQRRRPPRETRDHPNPGTDSESIAWPLRLRAAGLSVGRAGIGACRPWSRRWRPKAVAGSGARRVAGDLALEQDRERNTRRRPGAVPDLSAPETVTGSREMAAVRLYLESAGPEVGPGRKSGTVPPRPANETAGTCVRPRAARGRVGEGSGHRGPRRIRERRGGSGRRTGGSRR